MKKIFALLLALCLLLGCALAEEIALKDISKYGNMTLDISARDFLALGFDYGDIVDVKINGASWEMPVGSSYSDVDNGMAVCRVVEDEDAVVLAINMGDLATAAGIAVKTAIEEEPGYRWDYLAEQPVYMEISMKEPRGYYDQWLLHQLVRTNERGDYAQLSDSEFANFRPVDTTGMGEGVLYRSSSPVNPELGRNAYADAALKQAGVETIVNLADAALSYEGVESSHYYGCNVALLNLGVDFSSESFGEGLAKGLRFMIENEGPYLVHCTEGKDRAGFVSAVLESLMGAGIEEIVADYMESYFNYYGVQPGTEQYEAIAGSNIEKSLAAAFGVEDIHAADLAAGARSYLTGIGLSEAEIAQLAQRLAG